MIVSIAVIENFVLNKNILVYKKAGNERLLVVEVKLYDEKAYVFIVSFS